MTQASLDFDRLFKLRLVVARFGEMDLVKWWNSHGQLGPIGAAALRRGFPRTHQFAAARSVFAIAAHRCAEVFDPLGSVTLWNLPQNLEEEFEARWDHWIQDSASWSTFFEALQRPTHADLPAVLRAHDVVSGHHLKSYSRLRRAAEGRAVPLPDIFSGSEEDFALLALGFARGEPGALAVPYARRAVA